MGKKPQKTKELSVAIAEASSSAIDVTEPQQQQPPPQPQQAPRKRGRPRKIIVKMESGGEEKKAQPIEQEAASIVAQGMEISSMEKGKGNEEEQHEGSSQACMSAIQQGGVSEEMQLPKGVPSRSRARRKSKPRKSS